MRGIVLAAALAALAGCQDGGISVERMEAALQRSETVVAQAQRAVDVATEALAAAKAAGVDPASLAKLEAAVATAADTATRLQAENDQLKRDVEEAKAAGKSSVPWDRVADVVISTAMSVFLGVKTTNAVRDKRRLIRGEKVGLAP